MLKKLRETRDNSTSNVYMKIYHHKQKRKERCSGQLQHMLDTSSLNLNQCSSGRGHFVYNRDATLPLFKGISYFNTRLNLKKTHHRSIHNIRLQMIIDIQVFEFYNTCTVGASMAVVRLTSMEALILYIDPSPQPTAGKRPCARVATGHCLQTNGTSV